MELNINTQLKLRKRFLKDKRVEKLKKYNNWARIIMIYMMLVGLSERSKTGNVVVFDDGTPIPFCRMNELLNFSKSFLEYSFSALRSVSLIETIVLENSDITIVATNGLFTL